MIQGVRFRNFKALRHVDLPLERFTVLVGPNASGKSSVLEGIHHLTRLASTDPREVFKGAADVGVISSRGAEGVFELGLIGSFRGKRGHLSVSFAAIEDYPFSDTCTLEAQLDDWRHTFRREMHQPDGDPFPEPSELPLSLVLQEATRLELDRRRLAEAAYSDLPTPIVGPDGEGLAAVVADMAVSRPDDFLRLQDALRTVIPGLIRVRLTRAKVQRRDTPAALTEDLVGRSEPNERVIWGHEIVFDMKGAADIPARAASEGTLILLGFFTALMGPERQQIVLIDHLERAVGMAAMRGFVTRLNEIIALRPGLQIVATTESPALLDHMQAEEIRVHTLLPDGSAAIKSLSDHPGYDMVKNDLLPGEFWREVGDEWVADARAPTPPPETPRPPASPPTPPKQTPPKRRKSRPNRQG